MVIVKCVEKLRDKNGVIYGYTLEDVQGKRMNVQAEALKQAIITSQVQCVNLKLTSDGKLVDDASVIRDIVKVSHAHANSKITAASIFGVSLKNIKTAVGREGHYCLGDVYLNGKKLGAWSQDGNGAICDWFDFNENILKESLNKYSKLKNMTDMSIEQFMSDLIILSDYFKIYKKAVKNGHKYVVVCTDDYDICVSYFTATNIYLSNGMLAPKAQELIDKYKAEIAKRPYGGPIVKIFDDFSNFVIE